MSMWKKKMWMWIFQYNQARILLLFWVRRRKKHQQSFIGLAGDGEITGIWWYQWYYWLGQRVQSIQSADFIQLDEWHKVLGKLLPGHPIWSCLSFDHVYIQFDHVYREQNMTINLMSKKNIVSVEFNLIKSHFQISTGKIENKSHLLIN